MEAVFNQEGVQVLPLKDYNPVEPRPDVVFDDELYNQLSGQPIEPQQQQPPTDVQTPSPETPTDGQQPAGVDDSQQAADPAPAQEPVQTIDVDALIKERTGGKFEKLDDLLSLSDKPTAAEIEFANEQSKMVYEYLKEGKVEEVTTFLAQKQYLNKVDSLSPLELLQLKIQMTMPELEADEQQDELSDALGRYGLNISQDDFMTTEDYEKAVRKGQRRLKADLASFVDEVKAFNQELTLPALQTSSNQTQQSSLDVLVQALTKDAATNMPTLGELKLSSVIDKDVRLDYNFIPDEAQKAELTQVLTNYEADFKQRYSKDGQSVDYAALQRDIFIRNNFDKILSAAMKEAYMKGKLGQTLSMANATAGTPPPSTGASTDVAAQSYLDGLVNFLKAT